MEDEHERENRRAGLDKSAVKSKRKPVIRLNDGRRFDSILDAAKASGLSHSAVSMICNGRLASARGLSFTFDKIREED